MPVIEADVPNQSISSEKMAGFPRVTSPSVAVNAWGLVFPVSVTIISSPLGMISSVVNLNAAVDFAPTLFGTKSIDSNVTVAVGTITTPTTT